MKYVFEEVFLNGCIDARFDINCHAREGERYVGWIPKEFDRDGKLIKITLIFEVPDEK